MTVATTTTSAAVGGGGGGVVKKNIAPIITVAVLLVLALVLFWRGHGFYVASVNARLDHPDLQGLKPSGTIGQGYGVAGTVLILTNLLYLLRRRFARFQVGSLRRWLDVHVVAGLSGALLVAFHSTFQLRTPIAMATGFALSVLVVTGLVGLYIYRLVPKAGGLKLQQRLVEVENVFPEFARRVREATGEVRTTRLSPSASFLKMLVTVPQWTREARARRQAVENVVATDPMFAMLYTVEPERVIDLMSELSDLAASEVDSNAGTALMRSWRSLHGFMAILMVLTVTVHVAVAWFYGYRWLFSS